MPVRNEFEKGLLKYLSTEQLNKIQTAKIGIAGAGGLGSNIAHALVRTGFIDFEIIDHDNIQPDNLNRQNFYLNEIGKPKVEITAQRLLQINPEVSVQVSAIYLDSKNIWDHFLDRTIIFEAFDNVESKKLLLETFGNSDKLLIFGSGMAGIANIEIKINKVKENVFIVGDGLTEVSPGNPPLAPRVMVCAALMASVAVNQVLLK